MYANHLSRTFYRKYTHELRLEVIASDDVQDVKNQVL